MKLQLDHIAVLSESLAETEAGLPSDLKRHEVETFQSEGTKEQYVELRPEGTPYLLLLESIAEGPYRRTLEKRGPGLHHFGYVTDNLEDGVKVFSERGLLMHPVSLETMKKSTIWLCRPGIPFLVELTQITRKIVDTKSVTKASIPNLKKDIDWMPGIHLTRSESREIHLKTRSTQLSIKT